MKRLFLASVLIAALAGFSNAVAGSSDYGGKIDKGGKVGIDTDGGQEHVDRIRYEKFPAKCDGNPNFTVEATWTPASDIPITDNKFAANLVDGDNTLQMTGKLKNGGEKITGELKSKLFFDGGATKCTTKSRDYSAKLGRDTTNGDPKAAYRAR